MFLNKKTITTLTSTCLIILSFVFTANIVYAETATGRALDNLSTIGRITGFGEVDRQGDVGVYAKIAFVINILLGFAGVIATILIIVAGTKWIMAGGNEEQITQAKGTIKGSVIGLGIVLASYIIVNFIVGELINIFTK